MKEYQKIWIKHNGPIPKDFEGRSYEIHHIDGNHKNNNIDNLKCISIREHYDIHWFQNDYYSCALISKRLVLPIDHLIKLQTGTKRPGIGGVKKGTIPWNKGLTKNDDVRLKENGIKISKKTKGIRKPNVNKLSIEQVKEIKKLYNNKPLIDGIGVITGNGKKMSYEQAFSQNFSNIWKVTPNNIKQIITNKTWTDIIV